MLICYMLFIYVNREKKIHTIFAGIIIGTLHLILGFSGSIMWLAEIVKLVMMSSCTDDCGSDRGSNTTSIDFRTKFIYFFVVAVLSLISGASSVLCLAYAFIGYKTIKAIERVIEYLRNNFNF